MSILKVGPPDFDPGLIIFDKDGTLIHFDAMWGGWVTELADRLEAAAAIPARDRLFEAMGFDAARGRVIAHGKLAAAPMSILYPLTVSVMRECGLSQPAAESAVAAAWHIPDPVLLARPFADLPALFGTLRTHGVKVAIATTDDRAPTEATLAGLGAAPFVDTMVCADDGLPVKPAPDMVTTICDRLGVPLARTVVVGDSAADLQMGRGARAGLVVGVLSGISAAETLAPLADVVIESVARLV